LQDRDVQWQRGLARRIKLAHWLFPFAIDRKRQAYASSTVGSGHASVNQSCCGKEQH
jgi:hypothetical protein